MWQGTSTLRNQPSGADVREHSHNARCGDMNERTKYSIMSTLRFYGTSMTMDHAGGA